MSGLTLPYGRSHVSINLRHPYSVVLPNLPDKLPDPVYTVNSALDKPYASARLEDTCKPGERVVIIASDITRPVPYDVVLPPLLERLWQAGVTEDDITVLFANGTHRLMSNEDATSILGPTLAARLRWVNHDAHDDTNLVHLGCTTRGTPVWINRLAVEADRIILTGAVVHHYFAGFGGGRKCLVPGISGMETALANHKLVLGKSGRGLDPACRPGNLTGNPVHEDIVEACQFLPPDFLLNVVLDSEHRVLHATAGAWQEAHQEACCLADAVYSVQMPGPADLVIASCGGFPKDINVIQAHKTFDHMYRATTPGKVLLLVAECSQGTGSHDFFSWLHCKGSAEIAHALTESYSIHGHTALTCRAKAETLHVILLSTLDPDLTRKMGMLPATSLREALHMAYAFLKTDTPKTYVFPYGSLTVPYV